MQLSLGLASTLNAARAPADARGACTAAPSSAGLVHSSTSDTGHAAPSSSVSIADLRMARVRRGVLSAASVIQEELEDDGVRCQAVMVTTTYRPDAAWGARHLTASLKCLREWARRRRIWIKYVSRLEFTQRGVPHYHVLVWFPVGELMPMWDKQGWWLHGMTRTTAVSRSAVGYLAKYASKACDWPPGTSGTRGARWYGVGGLSVQGRLRALWRAAPKWVRDRVEEGEPLKRLTGSWWRLGAWEIRSPWRCVPQAGGCVAFEWRGWDCDSVRLAG